MATKTARKAPALTGERISRCRKEFKKSGAGALLVTNSADYFYLTGFTGEDSAALITPKGVCVLTDGRFEQEVKREVPWAEVRMRKGLLNDEIVKTCKELRVKKLAVQGSHFTVGTQAELAKNLNGTKIVLAPPIFENMRRFKGTPELSVMQKAIKVAEDAFTATLKTIKAGQTELEMAARIEYEMKRRGATAPAFPTICAEGPNSAVPHAVPCYRKVKKGSAILFDWGARVDRYCSDLTRMVFVGTIPPKFAEIYDIVLEAQLAAIDAIAPGQRMCDVDAVARGVIKKAGYGERFTHGLGHGLGLDVHEAPSLSWRSDEELKAGMVVTVEPGIYLPGVGGVRIEDDVLVTKKGHRVLTRLPKTLKRSVI